MCQTIWNQVIDIEKSKAHTTNVDEFIDGLDMRKLENMVNPEYPNMNILDAFGKSGSTVIVV